MNAATQHPTPAGMVLTAMPKIGDNVVSGYYVKYSGTVVGFEEGMVQVRYGGGIALRPLSELRAA